MGFVMAYISCTDIGANLSGQFRYTVSNPTYSNATSQVQNTERQMETILEVMAD